MTIVVIELPTTGRAAENVLSRDVEKSNKAVNDHGDRVDGQRSFQLNPATIVITNGCK